VDQAVACPVKSQDYKLPALKPRMASARPKTGVFRVLKNRRLNKVKDSRVAGRSSDSRDIPKNLCPNARAAA